MRLQRLRGRKVCDRLLRKGRLWRGRHMDVRYLPFPPRHPAVDPLRSGVYVGTIASARLHKSAVKRNRMRRRCREAFRVTLLGHSQHDASRPVSGAALPRSVQLLILPRSSSLACAFAELLRDSSTFLSHLPPWPSPGSSGRSSSSR